MGEAPKRRAKPNQSIMTERPLWQLKPRQTLSDAFVWPLNQYRFPNTLVFGVLCLYDNDKLLFANLYLTTEFLFSCCKGENNNPDCRLPLFYLPCAGRNLSLLLYLLAMDFLKSAVASAIAKGSSFPYSFGDRVDDNESIWTLHNGTKRVCMDLEHSTPICPHWFARANLDLFRQFRKMALRAAYLRLILQQTNPDYHSLETLFANTVPSDTPESLKCWKR